MKFTQAVQGARLNFDCCVLCEWKRMILVNTIICLSGESIAEVVSGNAINVSEASTYLS